MTIKELNDNLNQRLDDLEESRAERHQEVLSRLAAINGRVSKHDAEISGLKVRDAYWAGGLAALMSFLKLLWR